MLFTIRFLIMASCFEHVQDIGARNTDGTFGFVNIMNRSSHIVPVFIGGSPSTGSTLLRILLDRHPDIFSGPEISVFNKQVFLNRFGKKKHLFSKWLDRGLRTSGYSFYYKFFHHLDAYGISREQLIAWSGEAATPEELLNRFMQHCLKDRDEHIFVEKTPSNAYSFPELVRMYPQARCVHLYRDGRDVLCSLRRRRFTWFQASSSWLFNTTAAWRMRGHPRYFESSYEELVNNTEDVLRALCSFIGVEYLPEMLDPGEGDFQASHTIRSAWRSSPVGKIRSASVNRHQNELSALGRAIFSRTRLTKKGADCLDIEPVGTVKIMDALGYDIDRAEVSTSQQVAGYMQKYSDWVYRTLKSWKHLERPDPPLTQLEM